MLKNVPQELIYEQLMNLPVENVLNVTKYLSNPFDPILWRLLFKRDFPKYPTKLSFFDDWYEEYKRVYKLCNLSKKIPDSIVQEDILQFILDNFNKEDIKDISTMIREYNEPVFDGSYLVATLSQLKLGSLRKLFKIGLDTLHFKIDYYVPKIYFKNCDPFVKDVDLFSLSLAYNIVEHRIEDFIAINADVNEGNFVIFYAIEGNDPEFNEAFLNYLSDPNSSLDIIWNRMNKYEKKNGNLLTPLLDEMTLYWINKYNDAVELVTK